MPATIEQGTCSHNECVARQTRIAPLNTEKSSKKMAVPFRLDRKCSDRSVCLSKSMATMLRVRFDEIATTATF